MRYIENCFDYFKRRCSVCGRPLSLHDYRHSWEIEVDGRDTAIGLVCSICFNSATKRKEEQKRKNDEQNRPKWGGWAVGNGNPFW